MLKEQKFSDSVKIKLNGLALYQIAGGVLGLLRILWMVIQLPAVPGFAVLLFLLAFLLFIYSIYCGILLIKHNPAGLYFSLINQYLQLLNLSVAGYGFVYISGFFISVGINLTHSTNFNFDYGLSIINLAIRGDSQIVLFNINIIALILILLIDKTKIEIKEDNLVRNIMKQPS